MIVPLSADRVKEVVAGYYGLQLQEFERPRSRARRIMWARHVAVYLAHEMCGSCATLPALGRRFYRDHSTVIQSLKTVQAAIGAGEARSRSRHLNHDSERARRELQDLTLKLKAIAGADWREQFIGELACCLAIANFCAGVGRRHV